MEYYLIEIFQGRQDCLKYNRRESIGHLYNPSTNEWEIYGHIIMKQSGRGVTFFGTMKILKRISKKEAFIWILQNT